ncbi:MAG: cbb3-type cytochrome c oxidase subunit I [Verrucomicrobiaceae bacterium]|nr:cbb3-type cytochrome c oxidase subunit I [Verrucomicrobiaceae bacterium]
MDPDTDSLRRAAIDRSVKGPVLFLFTNAAFWLMASTLMGFLAAAKLLKPDFIADCAFLTYGRMQPAHIAALVYGWGIQAALGVALWLMARRTANELKGGQGTLVALGVLWNVAVTYGIVSILAGNQTSIEWLEMPKAVWIVLGIILLVFCWRILSMAARTQRSEGFTITTWYLVGASLWIVWILWTAIALLGGNLELGAIGAGISAWYVHGLILLFFVPVGVGAAYYFIPKITGQPIHSAQLAQMGFWILAVIGGWTGMQRYLGGPLPAWMPAVGAMAGVLLMIPVGVVGINHHLTTLGQHKMVAASPTLRFTFIGALFYPVSGIILALISAFTTGVNLQFTHAWYGYQIVAVYGFFSMAAFGAIYYIVPRLAGCEWLSVRLIRNHFWFSVYGIGTIVVTSLVGGVQQGSSINDPLQWDQGFVNAVLSGQPYMAARCIAWALILWSNAWFLIHLLLMVAGLGRRSSAPTLLTHGHEEHLPEAANA